MILRYEVEGDAIIVVAELLAKRFRKEHVLVALSTANEKAPTSKPGK